MTDCTDVTIDREWLRWLWLWQWRLVLREKRTSGRCRVKHIIEAGTKKITQQTDEVLFVKAVQIFTDGSFECITLKTTTLKRIQPHSNLISSGSPPRQRCFYSKSIDYKRLLPFFSSCITGGNVTRFFVNSCHGCFHVHVSETRSQWEGIKSDIKSQLAFKL